MIPSIRSLLPFDLDANPDRECRMNVCEFPNCLGLCVLAKGSQPRTNLYRGAQSRFFPDVAYFAKDAVGRFTTANATKLPKVKKNWNFTSRDFMG